ncbi:MAG: hypothetical protein BRD50_06415 [Bacteroidetes bacterium SW_11_45_7]|nr:MAG: hypothetical protein BRD50_06415 [Bacteroidetes bacterium SW_11_45_7]
MSDLIRSINYNFPSEESAYSSQGEQDTPKIPYKSGNSIPVFGGDEKTSDLDLMKKVFGESGHRVIENWHDSQFLSGRIINVTKHFVTCEYIAYDGDEKKFEVRKFPIMMFNHMEPLQEGKYIRLKMSKKPGSSRIDIFEAHSSEIEKKFEIKENREKLKNITMDEPPKRSD